MILRARHVLPLHRPILSDGAVRVLAGRIQAVGRWRDLSRDGDSAVQDLGEVVLLPGLVNSHCHLDYTDMAGQILPCRTFTDWIKSITATKGVWTEQEFAVSWRNGAEMLLRTGTTSVGDIEAVPGLLPAVWAHSPLRTISFLEMTGVRSRRPPQEILAESSRTLRLCRPQWKRMGLSPHAPYSTTPLLLELTASLARKRRLRVSTHVAESAEELDMFVSRSGPMHDWLKANDRDMSDCGLGTPVQHLAKCGLLGPNLLAIHANYLSPADAVLLGTSGTHVVHCPRSHQYFGHRPFPRSLLEAKGVNICLGTDSLATVRPGKGEKLELSLFAEMRALMRSDPAVDSWTVLAMATVRGARALGLGNEVGDLSPGLRADLIAVPYLGAKEGACDAVVAHQGPVSAAMLHGRWIRRPQ